RPRLGGVLGGKGSTAQEVRHAQAESNHAAAFEKIASGEVHDSPPFQPGFQGRNRVAVERAFSPVEIPATPAPGDTGCGRDGRRRPPRSSTRAPGTSVPSPRNREASLATRPARRPGATGGGRNQRPPRPISSRDSSPGRRDRYAGRSASLPSR